MQVREIRQQPIYIPLKKNSNNIQLTFSGQDDKFVHVSRKWIQDALYSIESKPYKNLRDEEMFIGIGEYNFISANKKNFERMLYFEENSPEEQKNILEWIENVLKAERNYDENIAIKRINEQFFHDTGHPSSSPNIIKNFITYTIDKLQRILGLKQYSSEKIIKLRNRYIKEYYNENGQMNFIRKNRKNFEKFVSSVKFKDTGKPNLSTTKEPELKIKPTETTEPVPPLNKPLKTDLSNPLIERYEELKRTLKGQDGETYYTTQNKIKEIKKAAREGNISLVRKREFGLEASEIERLRYFEEEVFPVMDSSVQSTLDGLEMFNRYGLNKNDTSKGYNETTIGKLTLKALTRNPEKVNSKMMPEVIATDEVIRKYIEVFNKYANKDYKDSDHLSFIFENSYKIISEDTALKFIDTFKRFMYNQKTAYNVQMHLTDGVMGRFKGNKEIEAAVDELIKYSETLPKK